MNFTTGLFVGAAIVALAAALYINNAVCVFGHCFR